MRAPTVGAELDLELPEGALEVHDDMQPRSAKHIQLVLGSLGRCSPNMAVVSSNPGVLPQITVETPLVNGSRACSRVPPGRSGASHLREHVTATRPCSNQLTYSVSRCREHAFAQPQPVSAVMICAGLARCGQQPRITAWKVV